MGGNKVICRVPKHDLIVYDTRQGNIGICRFKHGRKVRSESAVGILFGQEIGSCPVYDIFDLIRLRILKKSEHDRCCHTHIAFVILDIPPASVLVLGGQQVFQGCIHRGLVGRTHCP